MTVIDANSPKGLRKGTTLKLLDGLISDSQNTIEKNELSLYREYIESIPLDEIKEGIDETLDSSERFLTGQDDEEEPISDDQSQLPTPQLNTPNLDANLLARTPTQPSGINATGLTVTEQGLLSPEEQAIRLRQRGMA